MHYPFRSISILFIVFLPALVSAQLVTTNPAFPTDRDAVVVYFNSSEGNAGLATYSGDVYAHTGVITEASVSASDWKYVKTGWGQNTPETRLTKIGSTLYKLEVGPSVRAYYGVPAGEKILKMAMVFRSDLPVNNGGYYEGKTASGGDIFIELFEYGLNASLNAPASGFLLPEAGDTLDLLLRAQAADSLFLFLNDSLLVSGTGDSLAWTLVAAGEGKYTVSGVAKDSLNSVADSFYFFIRPPLTIAPLPAGVRPGFNPGGTGEAILCLYAPQKQHVFLIGDFTAWELDTAGYMARTPDLQYYWKRVKGLDPAKEYIYQYLVDGEIRIGDPYAHKVSDPWNDAWIPASSYPGLIPYPAGKTSGIASVIQLQPEAYAWQTTQFTPPPQDKLVVYELLVRDFSVKQNFQGVIDSLGYLKRLGVNAVELMPVNEFEGNLSWGYNPNFYFAVDKYYGRPNDLKRLVDTLHSLGIAVILDVVYNHTFGSGPYVQLYWDKANNRPSAASPFYNMTPRHDFNVGYDMNHESAATRRLVGRALKYWLEEFRVDGFRFDLSKGFTQRYTLGNASAMAQYDASRIAILSGYADTVWSVNPMALVILEHFADNTEEVELQSRG
ncbi:MAG TPA: alpha-amylase family glycosyl hydrolase, partial [Bacteroidales bacterium]|nr:alpha-amylase family glycosyl hydrolase [Bacteroidales bacterium]